MPRAYCVYNDANKYHNESDSERHKQLALNHLGQMTIGLYASVN